MLRRARAEGSVTCDNCKKEADINRVTMTGSRWVRITPFAKEPQRMIARTSLCEKDFCDDVCVIEYVHKMKGLRTNVTEQSPKESSEDGS